MKYFDYGEQDFIPCEACGREAVDIHHIDNDRKNNDIKNLIGLCRKCHSRAHGGLHFISKEQFQYIHNNFMLGHRKIFLK